MTKKTPLVGYHNLLTEGTTAATSETTSRKLAYNGLTYDAWSFEAGTQYLTVTFASARACDYFAFSRHNLHTVAGRVRLEAWDGAAWIAVTDWIYPDGKAQMVAFDTVTHEQYRVAVDTPLPAYIGVIYFGQRLTLIRGVGEGSIPSRQARNTQIIGVNSEGGQMLGRSLVRRAVRFPLLSRNYEPEWMRTEGQDFIDHAERKGFFYAFDLGENPTDVVFVEAVSIDQPSFVEAYRQDLSMECEGPRDEGERVPEQVQGLTVTPDGADLVLSWDAVTGADSYNVYRAESEGGPYTLIGSSLTAGFTDDGVSAGTVYWYQVAAVDSVGIGPLSNVASSMAFGIVVSSDFTPDTAPGWLPTQIGSFDFTSANLYAESGSARLATGESQGNASVNLATPDLKVSGTLGTIGTGDLHRVVMAVTRNGVQHQLRAFESTATLDRQYAYYVDGVAVFLSEIAPADGDAIVMSFDGVNMDLRVNAVSIYSRADLVVGDATIAEFALLDDGRLQFFETEIIP